MSLLGHVSKIVRILLSKLSDCPNTDTSLCYCNYPFLTVHSHRMNTGKLICWVSPIHRLVVSEPELGDMTAHNLAIAIFGIP